jgi:hypothetical protein
MNHPLEEVFSQAGVQSSEEIIERFKKVFGREMTPIERKSFFLDLPLSQPKEQPPTV